MKISLQNGLFGSKNKDVILSNAILIFILFGCVFVYFTGILPYRIPASVDYSFRYIIPALFCIRAITKLNSKNLVRLLIFELFFGLSYLFTFITGNVNRDQITLYLVMTIIFCVPFGVFLTQIDDLKVFYSGLVKISFIIFGIVTVYLLVRIRNTTTIWGDASYSMPAGYQLLLCLCVFTNESFKKEYRGKRILYLICAFVSFVMIFLYGSRGPIACYAGFLIYKVLIEFRHNKYIRTISVICGILLIASELFSTNIANALVSALQRIGVASRTVSAIISNQIFQDSGRVTIISNAIEIIKSNPIIGSGASSDLILLGGYPHNLFVELCIDFGVIIGLLLSLIIVIKVFRSLVICGDENKNLTGVFFACGFCMLMLSSTYLQNIYFFMFLGLMARDENSKFIRFKVSR